MYVDLDCTALAFDGMKLWGCQRSLLAHSSMYNFVPAAMLATRRDTPRRVGKYCRRGFGSFVAKEMRSGDEDFDRWTDAIAVSEMRLKGGHFNAYFAHEDEALLAESLVDNGSNYSETRLPRGYCVTPKHVLAFLERYQAKMLAEGRRLITSLYAGEPHVKHKLAAKMERWADWGMLA